jgi:hypothetical protein
MVSLGKCIVKHRRTFGILRPKATKTSSSCCDSTSFSEEMVSSADSGTLVLARYASSIRFVKSAERRASSPSLSASTSYAKMLCMISPASSISCRLCPVPSMVGFKARFHHAVSRDSPIMAGRTRRKTARNAPCFSGDAATCRWYRVWRSSWKRCESWSSMWL